MVPLVSPTCGVAGLFFLRLDVRQQVRNGLLHHPGRLHDLGQEHLARAEEITDDVHAVHQRALDHLDRATTCGGDLGPQFLGVGIDVGVDALDQGVRDPLADREAAPLGCHRVVGLLRAVEPFRDFQEPFGRVLATVQDDVLDPVPQLGVDRVVGHQRTRVDDAHVQAGLDGVVQEHRVDRLADGVVAPERERHVRDTAGDVHPGKVLLDPGAGLDEVDPVGRVLLDTGRQREAVRVEDDVLGREADLFGQDPVGAPADLLAALQVVGLTLLVEGHHDDGGAVLAAQPCLADELLLALLHGDRVDDRLALHVLQARLDDLPLGGVDHHRDAADVRLGRDQLGEPVHRGDAVDHALVHVDVDDLRTDLDLLQGDRQRGVVVLGLDQVAEPGGAGDVGALTDVHEQGVVGDVERLQAREPGGHRDLRQLARRLALDDLGDLGDVRRRRSAATTDQVDQAGLGELGDVAGLTLRGLVVLAEGVGQAGVRVAGDVGVRDPRHLGDVGPHLRRAQGAVEAHRDRLRVPDRVPECFGDLTGQRPPGSIGDGARDDHRPAASAVLEQRLDGEHRRLGVQRVEDRLDDEEVGTTVDQAVGGFEVGGNQLVVGDVAGSGVVDVRRDRRGPRRRPDGAGDVAGLLRGAELVAGLAGQGSAGVVQLVGQLVHVVVGERDRVRVERVRLQDVGARLEVLAVDPLDDLRLRQVEQVVVALKSGRPLHEPLAAVAGLVRPVPLDRRAHRAVDHHDPLAESSRQLVGAVGADVRLQGVHVHSFRSGRRP